jgi:hypothetical protein
MYLKFHLPSNRRHNGYCLNEIRLRQIRSREGRYLLRTNFAEEDPAKLWGHYLLLMAVEEAFKNLNGDLAIRPVFHQLEARIEAHVFRFYPPPSRGCARTRARAKSRDSRRRTLHHPLEGSGGNRVIETQDRKG